MHVNQRRTNLICLQLIVKINNNKALKMFVEYYYCHVSQWDEIISDGAFSCFIQNLCPVMSGNSLTRVQTAAAARTRRSLGHHLLHPRISRLLVLLTPADFEAMADLSS